MDSHNRVEERTPTLNLCPTAHVVQAGVREQTGSSIRDDEEDQLNLIEEQARFDNMGAEERNEKVVLVQKSLEAGIYCVSARAVASRMIDAIFSPQLKR